MAKPRGRPADESSLGPIKYVPPPVIRGRLIRTKDRTSGTLVEVITACLGALDESDMEKAVRNMRINAEARALATTATP